MRVATVNLNRRLFTRRDDVEAWCAAWGVDVLLVQECWHPTASHRQGPALRGLNWIGGDSELGAYTRVDASATRHSPHHLELSVGGRALHNVYLDAHKARAREAQLIQIADALRPAPALVAGDFNLAPTPEDGLYGGEASSYTKAYERRALAALLAVGLEDAGLGSGEFTFERMNRGQLTQFRCDLALVGVDEEVASFAHLHDCRVGDGRFTDHSGTLVDFGPIRTWETWRTRIGRTALSAPTRLAMERVGAGGGRVLDYGCGLGQDVARLRDQHPELEVEGYEPNNPPVGFETLPPSRFDLVLLNYVVNIIPTLGERLGAVRGAWSMVDVGGALFVSSRTPGAVGEPGERYLDGWVSSAGSGTFQRGHTAAELERLRAWLGEAVVEDSGRRGDFSWVAFRRPGAPVRDLPRRTQLNATLIEERAQLAVVVAALESAAVIGLDIETFHNRHRVLSTVQVAVEGAVFVVDALSIRDVDWLRPALEDGGKVKVIHNADFERSVLGRYGVTIRNVFCTLRVARASMQGPHALEDLVRRLLGQQMDKAEQRSDWSLRPLTARQIAYAAADAAVLLPLHGALREGTLLS